MRICLIAAMILSCQLALRAQEGGDVQPADAAAFMTGFDANYARGMAEARAVWKRDGKPVELFKALRAAGADSFRVRVWTGKEGASGLDYACATAKQAQDAGLRPQLVFFLSENWADYVKQPAPKAWAGLPFEEKLERVRAYSEQTARHFKEAGIVTHLYEIGNEIDFGICGEFEEKWELRFHYEHMRTRIWPRAARVISAAQKGILKVDPKARFVLHLTQWWNAEFCCQFLDAMLRGGARVELLGLSFFPSSGLCKPNRFADLGRSVDAIVARHHRPVIICETGYPSLPRFGGQFAEWNKPVEGYPLDPDGQRAWIRDCFAYCRKHKGIAGAFYWSPEWYSEEMWKAFALFDETGNAKPALSAIGER